MTRELYNWLQREFYFCNHSKYRHLFETWVSNITQAQIDGFSKQMYNKENHILQTQILNERNISWNILASGG